MSNNLGLLKPDQVLGGTGEFEFIISGIVNRIQTVTLVQVIAVNATGIGPVGTVDVQPMVAQLDGSGKAYAHGVIHNIPYFRLQGGSNAVIIDPEVGDIGMCGFCSRDISSVKVNKAPSTPQSRRKFDYADGLYFGGFLNGVPSQYLFSKIRALSWFLPVKFC
ncbi:Gp138 family membrane-puncturing spike protein [Mannheimia haemolytica]|uniref:Gp138 family membrane-puncturing spike protein n=1 Tax=Mannheimia haemolytica TaxID=75985 RepID=UPI001EFF49A4|nr:Gp138 family membrane-puncturing spike protein [Mannheimia haemolytica]